MVLALVLATFFSLAAAQWALARRRQRTAEREAVIAETESLRPEASLLHPGMAWVRPPFRQGVTAGASDFAVDFTGELERIELPRVGERLREGDTALTLVSVGGRRLTIPTPVEGRVLAVNPRPLSDPASWMLRIRPRSAGAETFDSLLQGKAARRWIDEARALVLSRLEPAVGPLAHDGGVWTHAWGELLDDEKWAELKKELFPEGNPVG